jgi:photosystem II stability/assembly factor-like uncharacterized protein
MNAIETHPTSAFVFLCGCSSGAVFGKDPNFESSTLRSKYLVKTTRTDMMLKEYLQHGAVGVIASTAGSDYRHDWNDPDDATLPARGAAQSFNYYFYDQLINQNKKVGDAFYDAHLDYVNRHAPQRGVRVFNLFGDPSLTLMGIDDRPGGTDVLIHEGFYHRFAADNADNGDMYVAAIRTHPDQQPGLIEVYKSSDHGQHWGQWASVSHVNSILDVDVVVGRWKDVGSQDDRVHVFYVTDGGHVIVTRINLNDSSLQDHKYIATETTIPSMTMYVSATRDPIPTPSAFNLYVSWEIVAPGPPPGFGQTSVARSADNGVTWSDYSTYSEYCDSDIEAGPDGHIYLGANCMHIGDWGLCVKRSTDWGATWGNWTNLSKTSAGHLILFPSVAASTDPALPAVWIAYQKFTEQPNGIYEVDLCFTYSIDGGSTWMPEQILSADRHADEGPVDMAGYRSASNPWVNIAYNYVPKHGMGGANVIWRHARGSLPSDWSAQRIVNDFPSAYYGVGTTPRVVYSPGAGPGSGVVYGGGGGGYNLYFSAPWLTGMSSASAGGNIMHSRTVGLESFPRSDISTAANRDINSGNRGIRLDGAAFGGQVSETDKRPLIWLETGELEGAFAVSSIIRTTKGVLYAGATISIDETRNQGVVFRSTDGGDTWEKLGRLDKCWSLACIFQSNDNSLIAGGSMVDGERAYGVIYRSENGGDTWDTVLSFPDGVVCDLMQTVNGYLYAATGWNGLIFKSEDRGNSWFSLTELGEKVHIYSIIQTSDGALFAAFEESGSGRIIRSTDGGETWIPAEKLEGVVAIYDLMESDRKLYAGVRGEDKGWIYKSDLDGFSWTKAGELPDTNIKAVHCLAKGPGGEVFAGVQIMPGLSYTKVFVMPSKGERWEDFGGMLDLATSVSTMLITSDMVYVGTGHIYGNVYRCGL